MRCSIFVASVLPVASGFVQPVGQSPPLPTQKRIVRCSGLDAGKTLYDKIFDEHTVRR